MVAHDKSAIAARYADCAALRLSNTGCPFGPVATTPDGSGGLLYGILLTAQTGDDCYRGVAHFFDRERLLASTEGLPPYSVAAATSTPDHVAVCPQVTPNSCTGYPSSSSVIYSIVVHGHEIVLACGQIDAFTFGHAKVLTP